MKKKEIPDKPEKTKVVSFGEKAEKVAVKGFGEEESKGFGVSKKSSSNLLGGMGALKVDSELNDSNDSWNYEVAKKVMKKGLEIEPDAPTKSLFGEPD